MMKINLFGCGRVPLFCGKVFCKSLKLLAGECCGRVQKSAGKS